MPAAEIAVGKSSRTIVSKRTVVETAVGSSRCFPHFLYPNFYEYGKYLQSSPACLAQDSDHNTSYTSQPRNIILSQLLYKN